MNPKHFAFVFASLTASALAGEHCLVYFGTYTNAKTGSQGIYVSRFDSSTGSLSAPEVAAETGSPSFLTIHPSKKWLYCVGEMAEAGAKGSGVTSFSIDLPSGKLTRMNQVSAVGQGPCHVNVDHTGKLAAIANYGSGSCASYAIKDDGTLSEAASFFQHEGSGADPRRQKGPHTHSVNFSPDNRFAFVCDLGLDKVLIYKIDPATGKMEPNDPPFAKVAPGSGPRHLAIHPSGKFIFVNNEMAMTETVFAYDAERGALTEIQTVSTLPPEDQGKPGFSTAESVAHPNGKFVYVSNRTHDTIAVFKCDSETGKLTLIQNASSEGAVPRNFCLDPSGKWMIVAHQNSNTVALFSVDQETGKLSFTGKKQPVGGCVCVRFLPLD
jgi:6-phosphogluconolactonase